ncbi:hypothetical protein D3C72_2022090 [compost metagenome]
MENTSTISTTIARTTTRVGTGLATAPAALCLRAPCASWRAYQPPMRHSTTMPTSAASENHARLACWCTISAASSGPMALPPLPPTWKIDCASPCWPPEAMRATRDDSGWKIDEPVPTSAAATSSTP